MVFTKSEKKNIKSPLKESADELYAPPKRQAKKDYSKYSLCIGNIIRSELAKMGTSSKSVKTKDEVIVMLNGIVTATMTELLKKAKGIMKPKISTLTPAHMMAAIQIMFPRELHEELVKTVEDSLKNLQAFLKTKREAKERGEEGVSSKVSSSNKAGLLFSVGRLVNPIRENSVKRFNTNIPYILGAAMEFFVRGMFAEIYKAAIIKKQKKLKKAESTDEPVSWKLTIDRMDIRNGLAASPYIFIFRYCELIGTGMSPFVLIAKNKRALKALKKTKQTKRVTKKKSTTVDKKEVVKKEDDFQEEEEDDDVEEEEIEDDDVEDE
jgi:hypothetical protein